MDIFDTLLSSDLPLAEKQPNRMANEVYNLLVAGSFTTSKTSSIAVYHVLANPDFHERLKQELESAIPDPLAMPDVKTLQRLPLLVRSCLMRRSTVKQAYFSPSSQQQSRRPCE